ncbi:hypothetical protein E4K72_07515 [Oxalobacteraceae bacterium OM1]|nr:hypothetical protein E4K72_07515 [Oxalobacteraceae bacterium OM1]
MIKKIKHIAGAVLTPAVLLGWLFIGVVTYSDYEEGESRRFFIKAKPTLQIFFANPYADDWLGTSTSGERKFDGHGNLLLGTEEFSRYLNYCEFRYGIDETDKRAAHDRCRAHSRAP